MTEAETFEREVWALHRARGRRAGVKFLIAYALLFAAVGVALAKDSLNGLYVAFGLLALVTGAGALTLLSRSEEKKRIIAELARRAGRR